MKLLIPLLAIPLLLSCGTSNDLDVKGGTNNNVSATVTIEHKIAICEKEQFDTKESIIECVKAVTSTSVDISAILQSENLTEEQLDIILGNLDPQVIQP